MVSLGKTFVAGVIWGTIEKFASLFIGFVITVLLARKLTPADYGLVNMIHIFTVFGMVLIDGGFGQALIQKRDVSNKDYSTIFFLNILYQIWLISDKISHIHTNRFVKLNKKIVFIWEIFALCKIYMIDKNIKHFHINKKRGRMCSNGSGRTISSY